jgi:hypothetical protein
LRGLPLISSLSLSLSPFPFISIFLLIFQNKGLIDVAIKWKRAIMSVDKEASDTTFAKGDQFVKTRSTVAKARGGDVLGE